MGQSVCNQSALTPLIEIEAIKKIHKNTWTYTKNTWTYTI